MNDEFPLIILSNERYISTPLHPLFMDRI